VFFFEEAHLLFKDASKDFLTTVTQTLRLIRSKGVGVFLVTQSPSDVPEDVLAQLGSRVQHQLRAHTPDEAKALRATVDTYPTSGYDDLGQVLTMLGAGEAIVTVMSERGAPTPVAWTTLRAPESLMAPATPEAMTATVAGSPIQGRYAEPVDRESAREMLAERLEQGAAKARAEQDAAARVETQDADKLGYPGRSEVPGKPGSRSSRPAKQEGAVPQVLQSSAGRQFTRAAAREIARGLFKVGRR
jgi:DNA helicase HerA-like ATPase